MRRTFSLILFIAAVSGVLTGALSGCGGAAVAALLEWGIKQITDEGGGNKDEFVVDKKTGQRVESNVLDLDMVKIGKVEGEIPRTIYPNFPVGKAKTLINFGLGVFYNAKVKDVSRYDIKYMWSLPTDSQDKFEGSPDLTANTVTVRLGESTPADGHRSIAVHVTILDLGENRELANEPKKIEEGTVTAQYLVSEEDLPAVEDLDLPDQLFSETTYLITVAHTPSTTSLTWELKNGYGRLEDVANQPFQKKFTTNKIATGIDDVTEVIKITPVGAGGAFTPKEFTRTIYRKVVSSVPQIVSVTPQGDAGEEGENVQFDALTAPEKGTPNEWSWTFNIGETTEFTSSDQSPIVLLGEARSDPDSYKCSVVTRNAVGESNTFPFEYTVKPKFIGNPPKITSITPDPVQLTSTPQTIAVNVDGGKAPLRYQWTFPTSQGCLASSTAIAAPIIRAAADRMPGTYSGQLTVIDASDLQATKTFMVVIQEDVPVVDDIDRPQNNSLLPGASYKFSALQDGDLSTAGTLQWQFTPADSVSPSTSSLKQPVVQMLRAGTIIVKVTPKNGSSTGAAYSESFIVDTPETPMHAGESTAAPSTQQQNLNFGVKPSALAVYRDLPILAAHKYQGPGINPAETRSNTVIYYALKADPTNPDSDWSNNGVGAEGGGSELGTTFERYQAEPAIAIIDKKIIAVFMANQGEGDDSTLRPMCAVSTGEADNPGGFTTHFIEPASTAQSGFRIELTEWNGKAVVSWETANQKLRLGLAQTSIPSGTSDWKILKPTEGASPGAVTDVEWADTALAVAGDRLGVAYRSTTGDDPAKLRFMLANGTSSANSVTDFSYYELRGDPSGSFGHYIDMCEHNGRFAVTTLFRQGATIGDQLWLGYSDDAAPTASEWTFILVDDAEVGEGEYHPRPAILSWGGRLLLASSFPTSSGWEHQLMRATSVYPLQGDFLPFRVADGEPRTSLDLAIDDDVVGATPYLTWDAIEQGQGKLSIVHLSGPW